MRQFTEASMIKIIKEIEYKHESFEVQPDVIESYTNSNHMIIIISQYQQNTTVRISAQTYSLCFPDLCVHKRSTGEMSRDEFKKRWDHNTTQKGDDDDHKTSHLSSNIVNTSPQRQRPLLKRPKQTPHGSKSSEPLKSSMMNHLR